PRTPKPLAPSHCRIGWKRQVESNPLASQERQSPDWRLGKRGQSGDWRSQVLISQRNLSKAGEQGVDRRAEPIIKIGESLARYQRRNAELGNNVVAQQRPVFKAGANISADEAVNAFLKCEGFQRVSFIKLQEINIGNALPFRRKVHIKADVIKQQTGIDEVALALGLARTQVGY